MEWIKKVIIDSIPIIHLFILLASTLGLALWITKYHREFMQEESGKLSMGRLLCFVLVIIYAFCAGYITFTKGAFPDAPAIYFALVAALYASNKFSPTIPFSPK